MCTGSQMVAPQPTMPGKGIQPMDLSKRLFEADSRFELSSSRLCVLLRVLGSRVKVALTDTTNRGDIFGLEFVVKYWHAKHEN